MSKEELVRGFSFPYHVLRTAFQRLSKIGSAECGGTPRKYGGNSNVKSSKKQLTNTSESVVPCAVEGIDRMPNGDPGVVLDRTTGR
jgi:hypothetical protein